MQVAKDTVVTLKYELSDADGTLIETGDEPIVYLHGGHHGIFPLVERALDGKQTGDRCEVRMTPDEAFGEYDADLVQIETRDKFPGNIAVGMQFEGEGENSGESLIYTVTDITGDKVVVDGNHPLAGQTLNFTCTIAEVRAATSEELSHGHVHGAHGHHH